MTPLPANVTPEKAPPMPRQSRTPPIPALVTPKSSPAGGPSAPPMPRLGAGVAPVPNVTMPQAGEGTDMGKVEGLLEELVRAQRKPMEQAEPSPLAGPVQDRSWQTLFNGEPLGRDEQGNSFLRRR